VTSVIIDPVNIDSDLARNDFSWNDAFEIGTLIDPPLPLPLARELTRPRALPRSACTRLISHRRRKQATQAANVCLHLR